MFIIAIFSVKPEEEKKNPNAQQVNNGILSNKKKQSSLHDLTWMDLKNHWHMIQPKSGNNIEAYTHSS